MGVELKREKIHEYRDDAWVRCRRRDEVRLRE